jgi:hypothetical protein
MKSAVLGRLGPESWKNLTFTKWEYTKDKNESNLNSKEKLSF